MEEVSTHEAKTRLSALISRVLKGEEVVICRGRQPVAKLVPVEPGQAGSKRLAVGTVTSGPVGWSDDAFASLGDDELRDWGL